MNYDWVFSFAAFADHLNFTRAAAALHITQPALHAQIRKLSEDVGATLYRRNGRALVLTVEGRRLAAFGREVQARGSDVLAELRGGESRGPIVLASGQGAFLYLLGSAMRRFPKDRWPLRAVSMSGPDTIQAVRDARADVGVAVLPNVPADLDCRTLRRTGQIVLLPRGHRLAKRRSLKPSDLDTERIVVAPEGSPHRVMLAQALAAAGAQWSVAVEATGWELMIQFVRYGLGIGVVNDFCPVPRGLVGVRLEGVPDVEYHVVTRPGAPRESRDTLVRLILESTA
ncbi:MAG: LysR family transcriptional regulator [Polyangiaceae bacterium]|nr:LysR family transcriptional regulator [Polyangiaceae bacterium]